MKTLLNACLFVLPGLATSMPAIAHESFDARAQAAYELYLSNCNYMPFEEFKAMLAKQDEALANCDWLADWATDGTSK